MAEIGQSFILPKPENQKEQDLYQALQDIFTQVIKILDRGVTFSENVDCRIVSYTSNGSANTEDTVAHTLGKVPIGYIVVGLDKASIVYNGTTSWTATNIYLKNSLSTVAVNIIVF